MLDPEREERVRRAVRLIPGVVTEEAVERLTGMFVTGKGVRAETEIMCGTAELHTAMERPRRRNSSTIS